MPRDLTDLMERATSFAPPEPHAAEDITRVAGQRQRRRTAALVAGVAAVVIAAGAIGYGTTRSSDRAPMPVGPPHDGLHVSVADAVPASSVAGFDSLDYGVPSVSSGLGPVSPLGIGAYRDVDAQGRLVVMRVSESGGTSPVLTPTYELVPAPGRPPAAVTSPGQVPGAPSGLWLPSFTGDGGLAWQQPNQASLDYLLTDSQGQHLVPATNDLSGITGLTPGGVHPVRAIWYAGGRVWFSVVTRQNGATSSKPRQWVSLFSVDPAHPTTLRAEKPTGALDIAVGGGEAVWVEDTTVKALDLGTGAERTVPVPMDPGCEPPPASLLVDGSFSGAVTTNGRLVSMLEVCAGSWHLVVTDLDGRLVTDVASTAPGYLRSARLSGDLLTFEGDSSDGSISPYVDDLTDHRLIRLGTSRQQLVDEPRANGRYVLWYDSSGGHVARIAQ